jgi:hypothetical protein
MIPCRCPLCLCLVLPLAAADYVVAAGSTGNGSADAPFGTIAQAAERMRAGDTCSIRGGIYRETLMPRASGSAGSPIIFVAAPGEHPVISGCEPLGNWTRTAHPSGKVWSAAAGASLGAGCDQVFVDGVMMVEARWPNLGKDPALVRREDLARAADGAVTASGAARIRCEALAAAKGLPTQQLRINILPGALWWPITGTVTGLRGDALTFTYPPQDEAWSRPNAGSLFFLWGSPLLLDAPREWARDGDRLLIWMPQGDDPARHVVEIKRRAIGIDLRGQGHVTIAGLGMHGCNLVTDRVSDGVVINGLTARYLTHYTEVPGWWVIYPESLTLNGQGCRLIDCDLAYAAGTGVTVGGSGCVLSGNLIHDTGYVGAKGPPVHLWHADRTLVEHNALWNSGGHNILEITESTASTIRRNDLSGSAIQAIDEGIVQLKRDFDGRGTVIEENWIHDNFGLGGGEMYYGNAGIYAEPGATGYSLLRNVIWHTTSPCLALTGRTGLVIDGNLGDSAPLLNGAVALNQQGIAFKRPAGSGPVGDGEPRPPGPYAGATIGSAQVAGLVIDQIGSGAGSTFAIGNLPPGRVPGTNFRIKVGNTEPGGVVARSDGRWLVGKVPWPKNASGEQRIWVQIGDDPPLPLPRRRKPAKPPDEPVAATGVQVEPIPGAAEAWSTELLKLLRSAVTAGRGPACSVGLGRERVPVTVVGVDDDLVLEMRMPGGGPALFLPWKKLAVADRLALAIALRREFDPTDNAVVAFFAQVAGDRVVASQALQYAGDQAERVRRSFSGTAAQ